MLGMLAIVLGGCKMTETSARQTLRELAREYGEAVLDTKKRDVCLRAIDLQYIAVTASLDTIRQLCGRDFQERVGENEAGQAYGIVRFAPMLPDYTDEFGNVGSGSYQGWYMVVTHESDQIVGYYLTNTHK